ncbi:MAG: hypothetical protein WA979_13170 [Pacificimonas sp.]
MKDPVLEFLKARTGGELTLIAFCAAILLFVAGISIGGAFGSL